MTYPDAYRLSQQHEASDDCWSHNVDEMRIGTPYIVCGECGHVYQSARALRKARRATMRGIYLGSLRHANDWMPFWQSIRGAVSLYTRRAKRIYHCPLCAHDF
jgi:hypothetical protein